MKRALVLLLLAACEDPLKQAQLLEEPRVLGVRVATADDHASLRPGDSATLEVLLAGPAGSATGRLAYQVCEAAGSVRGVPFCAAPPFAEGSADLDGTALALEVPVALAADTPLVVLGAVCRSGEAQLADEPLNWSCSDGTTPLGLSFEVRVAGAAFVNLNPDLASLRVRVGDTLVPLDGLADAASCDDAATSVDASTSHAVVLELGEGARDTNDESLQLSHFATAGEYSRTFSFVEPDNDLTARVEWQAPAANTAVKHYVVVRDGRGGVSWATFSLCVR